jgi:hypothetical protein
MAEDKVTESRPVEPVTVSVISTGDNSRLPTGTEAETPGAHQPNLVVQVVGPLMAISIRFVNVFLTSLLGILTGAMATDVIQADDFMHLLYKCAGLSVAGAVVGLLKDCITIFSRLEQKNPLISGNV